MTLPRPHIPPDRCPICGGPSKVIRTYRGAHLITRRRVCRQCDYRWTTIEYGPGPAAYSDSAS